MFILHFYRMYCSIAAGIAVYFWLFRSFWLACSTIISVRVIWFFLERLVDRYHVSVLFNKHASPFKELTGPYGIRLINKAEHDPAVQRSLAEVFVSNHAVLKRNVDQLEVMDTLFRSGLRPDGDTYQLHDLKLKYGKHRLETELKHHPINR